MPLSSPANARVSTSIEAQPTLKPPMWWRHSFAADEVSITIAPQPCGVIRRAAAVAVTKCRRAASVIGVMKSSRDMSTSGEFCTASIPTALNETSTRPAVASTSSAWRSTASRSSTSTSAACAEPATDRMSSAIARTLASVRPARYTCAPSAANARATALPIDPAAPYTIATLPSSCMPLSFRVADLPADRY